MLERILMFWAGRNSAFLVRSSAFSTTTNQRLRIWKVKCKLISGDAPGGGTFGYDFPWGKLSHVESALAVVWLNVCIGEVFLSWDLRMFGLKYWKRPRGYTFSLWDKDAMMKFRHPCAWFQIYAGLRLWAVGCLVLLQFKEKVWFSPLQFTSIDRCDLSHSQIKRRPFSPPFAHIHLSLFLPPLQL